MKLIFAHNTHNRPNTLIKTVEIEKTYFPDSECYLSLTENGGVSESQFSNLKNTKIIKTFGNTWQLGCVNCFYALISKILEEHEDGIIIFSHDDIFLKKPEVVKNNINKILNEDISFIVRRPKSGWGKDYFMMESLYLRVSHIKHIFGSFNNCLFKDERQITRDIFNYISAEAWLYNLLSKTLKKGLVIDYDHVDNSYESINEESSKTVGYEHLNMGKHAWKE